MVLFNLMFDHLHESIISQYRLGLHSIHGPSHWARVERNGLYICEHNGGNPKVISLFALFHDCKRVNEDIDNGHGRRAALYLEEIRNELNGLKDSEFELLHYACSWHTDCDFSDDPTIGACWDADRLDLGRVGFIPDAERLNSQAAKEIALSGDYSKLDDIETRDLPKIFENIIGEIR